MAHDADVIVVGAGLAGLVATAELADAGRKVILLDQEPEASLGGQAWWSFGGLFMVDTPEQRRLRVKDSHDLALQDWMGSAAFDREDDHWPRLWAQAYVDFASGEKRSWLHNMGMRWFPFVQWAERGGYLADGHGNSVPRFHVTWGTGPGVVEPFERRVREAVAKGLVTLKFRHKVTNVNVTNGVCDGVSGDVLEASSTGRAEPSSRTVAGDFSFKAQAVIVTSGGIGGNHDLVRRNWPERMGTPPKFMLAGVPDFVDGSMMEITQKAGGAIINADRMWHYPEGIANYAPVWSRHGIRILPGPSSLWLDAEGKRLPIPLFPGFDALGSLQHITSHGHEHSWFVLNKRIIGKEFALSGSEQNPDLTGKDTKAVLKRALPGAVAPVEAFAQKSKEFIQAGTVADLARGMNALTGDSRIDAAELEKTIVERDRQVTAGLSKDMQVNAIRAARHFLTDKLIRVVEPHRLLDPKAGPLIAVRLSVVTRKTLGGLHTDLSSRVLDTSGEVLPGLYAAGEAAGFGGGGVHGYRALEGTFLGGCLFSGRVAGRAAAEAVK
ncbi:FAD-binding dehydrogenase [Lentzea sp. BCCO 10_0798]|uniref:FAD-binding dehydrogenase n=1 Tax=Lentzea kristufekii TaxID=3095430 RepID=A0ABU4U2C0_9PSEU|nr:FAD-binding dehydrogenase [Lentzea sp. BCCO 10_0798]MDX8054715.1 FAD-binding dehydrogenase [Lentzea sp. BCCO 10_0798]